MDLTLATNPLLGLQRHRAPNKRDPQVTKMLTLNRIMPPVTMIVTPRMTSWRNTSNHPKMRAMISICPILTPYLTPERRVIAEARRLTFTWLLSRNNKRPRVRQAHNQTVSMLLTSPNLMLRLPIPSHSQTNSRMQDFSLDFPATPRNSVKTVRAVECLQREFIPMNKVDMDRNGHPSIMEAPCKRRSNLTI